jgi:hypothetical protein
MLYNHILIHDDVIAYLVLYLTNMVNRNYLERVFLCFLGDNI